LSSYGHFLKKAWNETFLPGMTEAEREQRGILEYFFGVPSRQEQPVAFFISFGIGWILHTAKSLIKLPELIFAGLTQTIACAEFNIKLTHPTSMIGKGARGLGIGLTTLAYGLTEGIQMLLHNVTSPVASFKEFRKKPTLAGAVMGFLSLAMVGIAGYLAFPFIAAIAVAAPIVPCLIGGAVVVFNEAREQITEAMRPGRCLPYREQKLLPGKAQAHKEPAQQQHAGAHQPAPVVAQPRGAQTTRIVSDTLSSRNGASPESILHARFVAANATTRESVLAGRESASEPDSQGEVRHGAHRVDRSTRRRR
jgi:hypothetical protein